MANVEEKIAISSSSSSSSGESDSELNVPEPAAPVAPTVEAEIPIEDQEVPIDQVDKKDKKKKKKKKHAHKESISSTVTDDYEDDDDDESVKEKSKRKSKKVSSSNSTNNSNMDAEAANQPEVLFETKRVPKLRVETEGKVLMRVYFADDSFKTIFIKPETTTIEEIWAILCEKLQLPPNEWSCFFLFGVSPKLDILMYAESTVSNLLSEWPMLEAQFAYQQSLSSSVRDTLSLTSPGSRRSHQSKVEYTTFQELPGKSASSSGSSTPHDMLALNRGVTTSSQSTLSRLTRTISMTPKAMSAAKESSSSRQPGPLEQVGGSKSTLSRSASTLSMASQSSSSSQNNYFKLMLKPTTILPLQEEAGVTSPGGINLFYMQAVHDTIESHYPTTVEDAIVLAGMQMYVTNGPYDPAVHKPGFLAPNLENFVPRHIYVSEKVRKNAPTWENKIYREQKKLGAKDRLEVMNMYLTHARSWPCYGATFFKVVHNPPNMGFYRQKGLGEVVLGINRLGLHVIDAKEMGSRSTPVVFYKWEEITSWDSDEETFFFEYIRPGMSEPVMLSFETSQGDYINDLMHDWMEEIESAIVKTNQFLHAQSEQRDMDEVDEDDGKKKKQKKKKKKKKHDKKKGDVEDDKMF